MNEPTQIQSFTFPDPVPLWILRFRWSSRVNSWGGEPEIFQGLKMNVSVCMYVCV